MTQVLLTGNSMKPFFGAGDILAVAGVRTEELRIGNVVMFQSPEMKEPIVHRIVDRDSRDGRELFVTRGDNNPGRKERVSPEWVMGRVIGKVRHGRLVTISRPAELLCLRLSVWYRRLRLLCYRPGRALVSLLYPMLPVRVLSVGQVRKLAVCWGKVVAEKKTEVTESSLWVHPVFRGTPVADRIADAQQPRES
jgi:signal peptidase I